VFSPSSLPACLTFLTFSLPRMVRYPFPSRL
jgi:hypothetical protein